MFFVKRADGQDAAGHLLGGVGWCVCMQVNGIDAACKCLSLCVVSVAGLDLSH